MKMTDKQLRTVFEGLASAIGVAAALVSTTIEQAEQTAVEVESGLRSTIAGTSDHESAVALAVMVFERSLEMLRRYQEVR